MMLFDRRQVWLGGLLMIVPTDLCCGRETPTNGCWIPDNEADDFVSSHHNGPKLIDGEVLNDSGVDHLEKALNVTLSRLQAMFGVLPSFSFYEEASAANAKAMKRDIVGNTSDGTVLLGTKLVQDLLALPAYADAAIVAVCAHEYGHVLSYANGMIDTLAPKGASAYRAEQFADFMSGYYAGVRKLAVPDFPAVMFAQSTSKYGGGEHGTGAQRAEAIIEGFKRAFFAKDQPAAATKRGFDFAMSREQVAS